MSTIFGQALFAVGVYERQASEKKREFAVRDPVVLRPDELTKRLNKLKQKNRHAAVRKKIRDNEKNNAKSTSRNREIANQILEKEIELEREYKSQY